MNFDYTLSYDEFTDGQWPYDNDVWEVGADVEADHFIKGSDGMRGHPDNWEPPTADDVEELFVYVNGVDVTNNLTQNAIDMLKEKAWDVYNSPKD
jgi:hypothetical protein